MEGGNINRLYYCALSDDVNEEDVVLVKVYGAGSEGWIDREKEVIYMRVAYSVGLAAQIYYR